MSKRIYKQANNVFEGSELKKERERLKKEDEVNEIIVEAIERQSEPGSEEAKEAIIASLLDHLKKEYPEMKEDDREKAILRAKEFVIAKRKEERENTEALNEARLLYLKAKRLRGNVFRGKTSSFLFRRKLEVGSEEFDFGGPEGLVELEKVRHEYQRLLHREHSEILKKTLAPLKEKLNSGEITQEAFDLEVAKHITSLTKKEQDLIDSDSVNGIEKNTFEPIKLFYRKYTKSKIGIAVGLGAVATTGGVVGGVALGTRAGMAMAGTYIAVEAGLERFTEVLGHRGLIQRVNKELPPLVKREHYSTRDKERHAAIIKRIAKRAVDEIPEEEIVKEASRLRMLQSEKGMSIQQIAEIYKDRNAQIAHLVLERDKEMTLAKVTETVAEDTPLSLYQVLSNRLSVEINERNTSTEAQLDTERVKKIFRKTTAAISSLAVGWLIGGKFFADKPDTPPIEVRVPSEVELPSAEISLDNALDLAYEVQPGDVTWNIIKEKLISGHWLDGLDPNGAEATHYIDSLKDIIDNMSTSDLKNIGFSSGDADLIYPGNVLDFSQVFDNQKLLTEALFKAKDLSPESMISIVNNNKEIAGWLSQHVNELKSVFDAEMVDKVLKGVI